MIDKLYTSFPSLLSLVQVSYKLLKSYEVRVILYLYLSGGHGNLDSADITTITSVFTAVGGLVVTALGYVGYQRRRDQLISIRKTFDDVVGSLASDNEERRLAGAVLLRRFFDETSELELQTWLPPGRKAPYSQEAVSVIAAVLRGLETGNLQKLLADGLAYASSLTGVDLQRTNLQNAYLRPRREGVTLKQADFYRADLTGASLKDTVVTSGVFYQARLCHTVFKNADLRGPIFIKLISRKHSLLGPS